MWLLDACQLEGRESKVLEVTQIREGVVVWREDERTGGETRLEHDGYRCGSEYNKEGSPCKYCGTTAR